MKRKFFTFTSFLFFVVSCLSSCGDENSSHNSTISDTTTTQTTTSVEMPTYDEDSFQIHYHRDDNDYDGWDLWLWIDNHDGAGYSFNGYDDFGAIASYPLSRFGDNVDKINFIVRKGGNSWTSKDVSSDQYFNLSNFTKDSNDVYHIYILSTYEGTYDSPEVINLEVIKTARFTSENTINFTVNKTYISASVYENDEKIFEDSFNTEFKYGNITLNKNADFLNTYTLKVTFSSNNVVEKEVSKNYLYTTDTFNNTYTYSGDDLGVTYTTEKSTFKLWAPGSKNIKLRIYENGTPVSVSSTLGNDTFDEYEMTYDTKGVYKYEISGDLEGKYYTYVITNSKYTNQEIVDPYAKSAGVNGLRGMIVDFSKTNPTGWDQISALPYKKTQLVVYETHVADVTSSDTWNGTESNRYLFNGVVEEGTSYTNNGITVSTGFDHINELGVNAIQLLPIFDQANDEVNKSFNWGYNPLNYNVVEGSYSSNPYDGYTRIKELKNLVMKFYQSGIITIMDVVYNHVNSLDNSNFNYILPGYYFRYDNANNPYNGSGCGNETASELVMFRKFMIDSTKFWASEYKFGGFRFDLMGLHDIETMNQIESELETINPYIVVYGEPWTGGTSGLKSSLQATQNHMTEFENFGAFNDKIRDGIKGSVFDESSTGWATETSSITSTTNVVSGIKGSVTGYNSNPNKTVNYVSCHDNNTLFDKLQLSVGKEDINLLSNLSTLCNGMIFTSQGISFMLAGEELLRSKVKEDGSLDNNSYSSSYLTNELDYSRLITYSNVFNEYKEFIELKTMNTAFQLESKEEIDNSISFNSTSSYIDYTISYDSQTYRVIISPNSNTNGVTVSNLDNYDIIADNLNTLSSSNSKLSKNQIVVLHLK